VYTDCIIIAHSRNIQDNGHTFSDNNDNGSERDLVSKLIIWVKKNPLTGNNISRQDTKGLVILLLHTVYQCSL